MNLTLTPVNIFACKNNAINQNNSVNKQSFNLNSPVITQKQMVNAQMALATYTIPKVNLSFKGSIEDDVMSDEEFGKLKKETDEKIKKLPPKIKKEAKFGKLNKYNINLVNQILSDRKFCCDNNTIRIATGIVKAVKTKEQSELASKVFSLYTILQKDKAHNLICEAHNIVEAVQSSEQAKLANRILSDKQYYENTILMSWNHAGQLIDAVKTKEQAELADKILSEDNLYFNEPVKRNAGKIIDAAKTKEQVELANKILSDKNLYKNGSVICNAGKIIDAAKTKEQVELANKILSDKNLYNNKTFIHYAGEIIEAAKTKEQVELVNKICSDKNLYNNETAIKQAGEITDAAKTKEQIELANKIFSDKKYYSNTELMEWGHVGKLIEAAKTKEQAELANKVLSDEHIYNNRFYNMFAGPIISIAETKEQIQLVNEVLSHEYHYNDSEKRINLERIIKVVQNKEQYDLVNKLLPNIKAYSYFNGYCEERSILDGAADTISAVKNKEQSELAYKFLSDEKIYKNYTFMKCAKEIIGFVKTDEQKRFAEELINDEENKDILRFSPSELVSIISAVDTKEKLDLAKEFIRQTKNPPKSHYNHNLEVISSFVRYANSEDQRNFARELFNNDEMYEKYYFSNGSVGCIIDAANTPKKQDFAKELLADEKLLNIKYLSKGFIADIIKQADTDEKQDFIRQLFDNKKLLQTHDCMDNMLSIIKTADTKEKQCLITKLLSDEDLINDDLPELMKLIEPLDSEKQQGFIKNLTSELEPKQIILCLDNKNNISYKDILKLNKTIGKERANNLSKEDTKFAIKFIDTYKKQNINEISREGKKKFLKELVAADKGLFNISDDMKQMFPLIPVNQKEYSKLIPSVVRSLGFDTNVVLDKRFDNKLQNLGDTLSKITDEDFKTLDIKQEYSRDDFIKDTLDKVKDLPRGERQKVYDYFGFELHHNKKANTGFTITGYPMNLNNGEKLAQIENSQTKAVIENLRENVIKFTQNNKIICKNKELENNINNIIKSLPELRSTIGLKQRGNGENFGHDYDVFTHSLKVMQGIVKDSKYQKLNDSDKKIMLFASLLHDIAKKEGFSDSHHADNSSFDASFIVKKFKLTQEEEIKLFTLIKNHEWNNDVNNASDKNELKKRQQSVAYDLRHDNLFDMSLIFTHADLKGVNDYFHDTKEGKGRTDFKGKIRSFGEAADFHAKSIKKYIEKLKPSQPLLPVTPIPKASEIEKSITEVNEDGSTNIKGIYKDKDGLIVIKYNELQNEDLEKIGFSCLSTTKGIEAKTSAGESVNTGNVKFFAHGFDEPYQLAKFDAFNLINSEVLLSVSYAERPESKYRFFRPQGILLDCDTKYVHGGGETDSGSGTGKFVKDFKRDYIFGGYREKDRKYISDLIKTALNMDDEKYKEFVEKYKNVPLSEIEPEETRAKLIKAFSEINSNIRKGKREYNEMYISNPKPPMAVFAYAENYHEKINNPLDFLNRTQKQKYESKSVNERTEFLREYALEKNIPFVIFGD